MSKARLGAKNGMFGKRHSEDARQAMRAKAQSRELTPERLILLKLLGGHGSLNPHAKPVVINGVQYGCIKDAMDALGVSRHVVNQMRKEGTHYVPFDRVAHSRECGRKSLGSKLSLETRKQMSEARQGAKHPRARHVLVNGSVFGCLKDAAKAHGLNYSTLRWRFQMWSRAGSFPVGFGYCEHSQ